MTPGSEKRFILKAGDMEEMEVRRLDGAKVPPGTMPIDLVHDVLVEHEGPFITGLLTSGSAAESRGTSNISRPRSDAESSSVPHPCQKPQPRNLVVI